MAKFSFERARCGVKHQLGREVGADRGGGGDGGGGGGLVPGRLGSPIERNGRAAQSEIVQFGVKVKSAGRSRGGCGSRSWPPGGIGPGPRASCGFQWALLCIVGNGEKILQGPSVSLTWTRSPINGGWVSSSGDWSLEVSKVAGAFFLFRPLGATEARTGRLGNLLVCQLDGGRGPEPVTGIDGVRPHILEVIVLIPKDTVILF